MKPFLTSFIFLLFSTQIIAQELGLPFSKYYSSQDYMGGIQNYAISQSESGLIYVANNFGLLEYDGTSWRRYSLPNSTKIRDIYIDDSGKIYVSGQGEFGYFEQNQNGFLVFHTLKSNLLEPNRDLDEVWKIYPVHDQLLFCTFKNIFVFSKDGTLVKVLKTDTNFDSFHLARNQFFVKERHKGLLKLENDGLVQVNQSEYYINKNVTGITSYGSNRILVFTRDQGIFVQSDLGPTSWTIDGSDDLKIKNINNVIRLKNGRIAIGTQDDGVYILEDNGTPYLHMNKGTGLQNNTVISLFEDVSGNLWIGHNNGISFLELGLPFRLINQYSNLSGTGYDALVHGNNLYYGTNNGVAFQPLHGNKPIELILNSNGQVYQLKEIQDNLLVAHNDGAFVIENNKAVQITDYNGVWNFQTLKNHPNLIISGTYTGLVLFEIENREVKFVRKLAGFDESSRIIEQDMDGNIWMTHGYKGVYKLQISEDFRTVEANYYGVEQGLPTNLLISVWNVSDRLVFSTEYGLYAYNSASDRFERDEFFLPYFGYEFLITSLIEDPLGNIFYIGENEIGVLEKQINGGYTKKNQLFNKIIPFLNDDLQNLSLVKANEILVAANDGFIWYKHDRERAGSINEFPTLIRSIYLTGASDSVIFISTNQNMETSRGPGNSIPKFDYVNSDLRFEFTNPTPDQETTTRFQFWLEGFEDGFGEWSIKREKAYTNLREGKYTFHVNSINIYGEEGKADQFSFEILPPWYRSVYAYIIYSVIIAFLALVGFKFIDKEYQKKTNKITAQQRNALKQKESDLEKSQKEIERLRTEKLEAAIQSKNKELASATMHLLNKNGFIDHTKTHLATIIKKSKNQEVKNEIQKVILNIDKNIAGDKDWEQFEIHFDQVHGDFMTRFKRKFPDLSPQEIKLSAYLRMNLSSKEIAYLMNISTRGVEIARYRLRKKIQLERIDNLQEFILKF